MKLNRVESVHFWRGERIKSASSFDVLDRKEFEGSDDGVKFPENLFTPFIFEWIFNPSQEKCILDIKELIIALEKCTLATDARGKC